MLNFSLSLATSSLLIVFNIDKALAANFYISSHGIGHAEGQLSFSESPLTGVGEEQITYEELISFNKGRTLFQYHYQVFEQFGEGTSIPWTGNPRFYFDSGNLVGMDLDSFPTSYSFGICRSFPCTIFSGTLRYSVRGNINREYFTGDQRYIEDPFAPEEIVQIDNAVFNKGTVLFNTAEPIPAVPEPSTMLAFATALGFGALLKGKYSKKIKVSRG
jgi:hypothetical protein